MDYTHRVRRRLFVMKPVQKWAIWSKWLCSRFPFASSSRVSLVWVILFCSSRDTSLGLGFLLHNQVPVPVRFILKHCVAVHLIWFLNYVDNLPLRPFSVSIPAGCAQEDSSLRGIIPIQVNRTEMHSGGNGAMTGI